MKNLIYKNIKIISQGKAFMYLFLIPISLLIIKDVDTSTVNYIVFYIILTLIPLLLGWGYLNKHLFLIENSLIKTLNISTKLLVIQWIIIIFYTTLTEDFHLRSLITYTYSLKEFIYIVPLKALISSFTEEILKIFVFSSILSFINITPFNKRVKLSMIISSLIFGLLYMVKYKIVTLIPISLVTIPTYVVFIKYSTIIPLIINHFILFILFHSSYIKLSSVSSSNLIYLFISLLSSIYIINYIYNTIKNNKKASYF